MLKKIGLPMMALAGLLAFATPRPADARIRFGIGIGGPVYTAPVPLDPYAYTYPYQDPYYAPQYYNAPPVYSYPYVAPAVPYGYGGFGFGWGGHDRHERYEHRGGEHYERGRSFGHRR